MKRWLKENSLSLVLLVVFLLLLGGQTATGFLQYNEELQTHNAKEITLVDYFGSGHFIEATFENWESEFLQMGAYVLLTVYLRQKGSAESKKLQGTVTVDAEPRRTRNADAPWPVRRGGWVLKVYENSLSLAFILLFLMSFGLHAYGGAREACEQNMEHGEVCMSTTEFMGSSEFWFQSFQNWQSEFLAVFAIVVLSIYLRQKGSPESKPVSAPHDKTGNE